MTQAKSVLVITYTSPNLYHKQTCKLLPFTVKELANQTHWLNNSSTLWFCRKALVMLTAKLEFVECLRMVNIWPTHFQLKEVIVIFVMFAASTTQACTTSFVEETSQVLSLVVIITFSIPNQMN